LFLNGLTTLTPVAAKALSRHASILALMGLESLSSESFLFLCGHPDVRLPSDLRITD